jgi:hypothetical protein
LQEVAAFGFENALNDRAAVDQFGARYDVEARHGATAAGVRGTEDEGGDAGQDDGSGAHGAGFLGDVERGIHEPPVPQGGRGLSDGDHFGVGGGIVELFHLVVRLSDRTTGGNERFAVPGDNDAAGRHFAEGVGAFGLFQGLGHVGFMDLHVSVETLPDTYVLVKPNVRGVCCRRACVRIGTGVWNAIGCPHAGRRR